MYLVSDRVAKMNKLDLSCFNIYDVIFCLGELESAMHMLLVTRKEPLLGVSEGRTRRDLGVIRTGTRRRPPTRKHLQERAACTDDLILGTGMTDSVNVRPRAWTVARQVNK